eukprot:TRINITY_DN14394_c0_g1_i1.p1 TRINITY_DN14394_c0_g1~~TRINITY_DN14394_c0_g1_i1.p1  ORF type:complete len:329 (-),score=50.08 TRINITY_DN14394_c0_g1_i1:444-1430(-)
MTIGVPHEVPPEAADVADASWTQTVCQDLQKYGCARVRLLPSEAFSCKKLYAAADALFNDRHERRLLEIPERECDDLDHRSGYVYSRRREFFELHLGCRSAEALDAKCDGPAGRNFLQRMWAVTDICQKRCHEALREIAATCSSPMLLKVLKSRDDHGVSDQFRVLKECLRVYRYREDYDRPENDTCYHFDIGLLTMIPRGTRPALLVNPRNPIYIEEFMGQDEALLMGGMTLARLTGIQALEHGVCTHSEIRFSAPFFQRVAPSCFLPACDDHPAEKVGTWNGRVCDAHQDELRSDGTIVPRERSRDRCVRRKETYGYGDRYGVRRR